MGGEFTYPPKWDPIRLPPELFDARLAQKAAGARSFSPGLTLRLEALDQGAVLPAHLRTEMCIVASFLPSARGEKNTNTSQTWGGKQQKKTKRKRPLGGHQLSSICDGRVRRG